MRLVIQLFGAYALDDPVPADEERFPACHRDVQEQENYAEGSVGPLVFMVGIGEHGRLLTWDDPQDLAHSVRPTGFS